MAAFKYVILIIVLSLLGVASITLIVIMQPAQNAQNNTLVIATIIGFLTPTIGTILAVMIKDIHFEINSRMTELIESTRSAALARGKLEGPDLVP